MSGYKASGIVKRVESVQKISEKFSKREIVIEVPGDYPQICAFELHQERCALADSIEIGDNVEIDFDLRGREWTNKTTGVVRVFNTLVAWKIAVTAKAEAAYVPEHTEEGQEIPF